MESSRHNSRGLPFVQSLYIYTYIYIFFFCSMTESPKSSTPQSTLYTWWYSTLALQPGAERLLPSEKSWLCLQSPTWVLGQEPKPDFSTFIAKWQDTAIWDVLSTSGPPLWTICLLPLAKSLSPFTLPASPALPLHDKIHHSESILLLPSPKDLPLLLY